MKEQEVVSAWLWVFVVFVLCDEGVELLFLLCFSYDVFEGDGCWVLDFVAKECCWLVVV